MVTFHFITLKSRFCLFFHQIAPLEFLKIQSHLMLSRPHLYLVIPQFHCHFLKCVSDSLCILIAATSVPVFIPLPSSCFPAYILLSRRLSLHCFHDMCLWANPKTAKVNSCPFCLKVRCCIRRISSPCGAFLANLTSTCRLNKRHLILIPST